MGAVKLELRCPQVVDGITVEPKPDWNFDALLSEINAMELNFYASSSSMVPSAGSSIRVSPPTRKIGTSRTAFVMHVSDNELDSDAEEVHNQSTVVGRCDELSLSDRDDSETASAQDLLVERVDIVDCALVELTREHQLGVKDQIRSQISALESDLMNEDELFSCSHAKVMKYSESRREMDRKLDTQYQRKIAEALDSHLTAVQRDHEHWSQIEERKIRSDATFEEAKRKEKAIQEDKLRQEKAKVDAEARILAANQRSDEEAMLAAQKRTEEEPKFSALEADKKAAAAEKIDANTPQSNSSPELARLESLQKTNSSVSGSSAVMNVKSDTPLSKGSELQPAGNRIYSTECALKLEDIRIQKYKEIDKTNQELESRSNKNFRSYTQRIAREIRQSSGGAEEALRERAINLMKILKDPLCPQSISIAMVARKVIWQSEQQGTLPFHLAHVIVLVTSKFPLAMDCILAEFHRNCIYTVPKHISYSEAAFGSTDAYKKVLGFREEDGKLEDEKEYLARVESHMKLYGALVQTEINGVQNMHGLKEGWAWVARLLNALPANTYTGVALIAFLEMAGYALWKRYKSQFRKILKIISCDFLSRLKAQKDKGLNLRIRTYMERERFCQEPQGWRPPSSSLSSTMVLTPEYHRENKFFQSNDYYHG